MSEPWTDNVRWIPGFNLMRVETEPRLTFTHYKPQPWPDRYRPGEWLGLHCMTYAKRLARRHRELSMVEGYAQGPDGGWAWHGWCVDGLGNVIDPSWRNEGIMYVGVEVSG